MFLEAGLPEDQIGEVLGHFYTFNAAPEILTLTDYATAKAIYVVMDGRIASQDTLSPVARYVISLGNRLTEWETKGGQLNS
ncbi:hypothetical protein E4191_19020 (plasmid) [Paracoccus liaowanqingii]|uniref:Uncharacterized protein n=1 Tax=Paracoccus liaowanqingii TaxID=2560053 RepID=A0A4Y5STW0_9RHOB|nr:hypothetical protein [Paracoccus liaowanqingii]QDA36215.1 hypothetical protein E4191_19020 [Paracoccus liaowanqingii]